ncbi:transposase [Streptomyces vastus]|uniref:Transposase IS116/IS110/IS902 C-terminal domain-containing protein n=1 Tax=Streptomyces vastus TaxID=285451 RepID=A0ABN3QQN1_9ACTN
MRYGHISKQGDPWLRWIMCEASQTAKRHPAYAATYARLSQRRGKKIATTAIASYFRYGRLRVEDQCQ